MNVASAARPDRRRFLGTTAVATTTAAFTAASYGQVAGANDRVRLGIIGFGLIGKRHLLDFHAEPDVQIVAIAEAHRGRGEEAVATVGSQPNLVGDFRRLLDRQDIDAVVISTPDHWHALQTMLACDAGKDVYVEKPVTLFPAEGRWMRQVAERTGRVVQIGTQQRSGAHYQRARELIQSGRLGEIVAVQAHANRNILPGYGDPPDGVCPPELDYDMWLGPAPQRPYNPHRALYHFRWYWDYSGGQMTNLGQHSLDIVDWIVGMDDCRAVFSTGGRWHLPGGGETPDVQEALFAHDRWSLTWSMRECSAGQRNPYSLVFHGTHGSLGISRSGFQLTADPRIDPSRTIPSFAGDHPTGGPTRTGQRSGGAAPALWTEAVTDRSGDAAAQFRLHARNFLDCVKSRQQPISDLNSGTRVATLCHLANISLRLGRALNWDAATETIVGDDDASTWLVRPYRAPWDAELKSLKVT